MKSITPDAHGNQKCGQHRTAKRLALTGFISFLFVVLTGIPGTFGESQKLDGKEDKDPTQSVVEKGDFVTVNYSSKILGGEEFERKTIKFRVGMGTAFRGIEKAVLGMKRGGKKTIEVSAEDGYGEFDAKKVTKIPRDRNMPRQKKISLAKFKKSIKKEPVEGKRYSLRGFRWPIKVSKVENGKVLLDLAPEKEIKIPAPIGYALVSFDDKKIKTSIVTGAKIGDQLTTNNGQNAKVVALDDQNITLDFNHPLVGKRLTFDFVVAELVKKATVTIPGLKKWEKIDGLSFVELKKKYRELLIFTKPYIVRKGIKKLVVPAGIPDIYGKELGVEFSPEKADKMITILRKYENEKLDKEQLEAYVRIGMKTSCEYCCRAKTLVRKNGARACGCAHSYAMRGLAKYLILNHSDRYSEDKILEEIIRWKALFFPKQSIQKVIANSAGTGEFDLSVLQEMPNMVGGC
jgi:FKBP-type peptidyl-prolyl cis-trans isomerase 2